MALGNLVVKLTADSRGFGKGLDRAKARSRKFVASMGKIMGPIAVMMAGRAAFRGAGEQEQAEKKLAATLAATGNAAGFTATQLLKQAAALQKVTNFGDETIINSQAVLATFKNIKGDQFKDATQAALDMSAVMGTDLQSSAVLVGKALNDPARGLSALTRMGVTFSEQQKKMIKDMQESGDVMGAQKLMLAELKSEFGGAAEAMADPFTQLKNSLGDVLEGFGFIIRDTAVILGNFLGLSSGVDSLADGLKELRKRFLFVTTGISFLVSNWKDSLKLMGASLSELLVRMFMEFRHFFEVKIPALFKFAFKNPKKLLMEGLKDLKFEKRVKGPSERHHAEEMKMLGEKLGKGWNEAYQKNMGKLIGPSAPKAIPAFAGIGAGAGEGAGGGAGSPAAAAKRSGTSVAGALQAASSQGFSAIVNALQTGVKKSAEQKQIKQFDNILKSAEEQELLLKAIRDNTGKETQSVRLSS